MNYKIRSLIQKVMIDNVLERFIINVPRVKTRNKWYELIFELEGKIEYINGSIGNIESDTNK